MTVLFYPLGMTGVARGAIHSARDLPASGPHFSGFKVPRQAELRTDPLPKPAAGKVLKRELREPHRAGWSAEAPGS